MKEPIRRRSRMRARSKQQRVEISKRDLEIFKLLLRFRFLRSNFIHAFVGGNRDFLIRRLGKLYHEGLYINRPKEQWQFANCRYMPAIYELGPKGEAALLAAGVTIPDNALLSKGRTGSYRQFPHAVMICDILASIELGVREDPKLRFVSWQDILANAPESTKALRNPFAMPASIAYKFPNSKGSATPVSTAVVPDALFGLVYIRPDGTNAVRYFALEADRATMPVYRNNLDETSILKKVLSYREITSRGIHKAHFGFQSLKVLFVTTGQEHMQSMAELIKQLTPQGSKLFLFKTMSTLGDFDKAPSPSPHILTEPWHRAGESDFNISKVEG